jgi:predicted RNA-binding protein with PUA-like domain
MVAHRSQEDKEPAATAGAGLPTRDAMPERFKPYVSSDSYWVLATDPNELSYDDLERDMSTVWDGVSEYVSLKNLRDVDEGDYALLLYTGDEPALVAIARVTSDPYPDPAGNDPTQMVFDLEPERRLETPVPLAELLDDPAFRDWELVSAPELEVAPLPPELWERILERSRRGAEVGSGR